MANFVLYETAVGYALFARLESEEIGAKLDAVQQTVDDFEGFSKTVRLQAFVPFESAAQALENARAVAEAKITDLLKAFLETNLSKVAKKRMTLGVVEKNLAANIKQQLGIACDSTEVVFELVRGLRRHAAKLLRSVNISDIEKAQLGLGHGYSRDKVRFNINRNDQMIIQAINLMDKLDKDINTFTMRIREWYSWHFPELIKIVNDNHQFALLAKLIGNKKTLTTEKFEQIQEIVGDEQKASMIMDAARASMGLDIIAYDVQNIDRFCTRVIELVQYRQSLTRYLAEKMQTVAPNLGTLVGDVIAARLISHAGSLRNLAKYPASTVQILGAEKALFRALRTKSNTPKFGLLYHSTFIGRADVKNKGRISRLLANKCALASRIDCFSDKPTSKFGEALRNQVEERLTFYETGATPTRNDVVMAKVMAQLKDAADDEEDLSESDEEDLAEHNKDVMEIEPNNESRKHMAQADSESALKKGKLEQGSMPETLDKKKKKSKRAESAELDSLEPKRKKKKRTLDLKSEAMPETEIETSVMAEAIDEPTRKKAKLDNGSTLKTLDKKKKSKSAESAVESELAETKKKKKKRNLV